MMAERISLHECPFHRHAALSGDGPQGAPRTAFRGFTRTTPEIRPDITMDLPGEDTNNNHVRRNATSRTGIRTSLLKAASLRRTIGGYPGLHYRSGPVPWQRCCSPRSASFSSLRFRLDEAS